MAIPSILKATVVALVMATGGPAFAQGTPIDAAAFDALVAHGPVADAATVASNKWASKIKQAGALRLGGTQTSNLFSQLNEKDAKMRGFDAGLAQLLTRYILGGPICSGRRRLVIRRSRGRTAAQRRCCNSACRWERDHLQTHVPDGRRNARNGIRCEG